MNERKLYKDIDGSKTDFHSAILTSFSFNLHYFEGQVLNLLRRKWISSLNLLVDQSMLDQTLGWSSAYLKNISQSYAVNGISTTGAFHPKINFFIGDKKLLVLFGSGNLTPGGHGKNHELFSGFYADMQKKEFLPLLQETWEYLMQLSEPLQGYSAERIRKTLPASCELLRNGSVNKHMIHKVGNGKKIALLYNEQTGIYHQLYTLFKDISVKKITVVSPYYDKDGCSLMNLISDFPDATMDVYLQRVGGLPPVEIPTDSRINFYDFDSTPRGEKKLKDDCRKLHSKIFHFETEEGEYCLIGSANATQQGLGTHDKRGANEEFCVLYFSKEENYLAELGLSGKKERIRDIHRLKRTEHISGDMQCATGKRIIGLKSVDLSGRSLQVYCDKSWDKELELKGYNLMGEECFSRQVCPEQKFKILLTEEELAKKPIFCLFTDKEEPVSNKQLINYLQRLSLTSPDRGSRTLRQLIGQIEGGACSDMDILEYISELNLQETKPISHQNQGNSGQKKEEDTGYLDKKWGDIQTLTTEDETTSYHISKTTQLLDAIEHLFHARKMNTEEELVDEEEEAAENATVSHERAEKKELYGFKSAKDARSVLSKIKNIAYKYSHQLSPKKKDASKKIGISDYQLFLLFSYLFNSICYLQEYKLPKDISEKEWQSGLNNIYHDCMLKILQEWALLHIQRLEDTPQTPELVEKQHILVRKMLAHVVFNAMLISIHRKNSEPVLEDKLNLRILILLDFYSIKKEDLADYLRSLSELYKETRITLHQISGKMNGLERCLTDNKSKYIKTKKHGICFCLESDKGKIKVRSLLDEDRTFPLDAKKDIIRK